MSIFWDSFKNDVNHTIPDSFSKNFEDMGWKKKKEEEKDEKKDDKKDKKEEKK